MSLAISKLRFHDFRNYEAFSLEGIGKTTVLVGPNAVGKTNIIEGIQLLTALESFRNPTTDALVRWGCEQGMVQAFLEDGQRQLEMGLVLDSRGRHYRLNGKTRPRGDLQGQLPAVLFSPDDLQLVKGGPDQRRAALDLLGMQVSRNYRQAKQDYEKLLRQKNRLLKEEVVPGYLASVNEVLARIGAQLMVYRLRIVAGMQRALPLQHEQSTGTGDAVELDYRPNVELSLEDGIPERAAIEEAFLRQLEQRAEDERIRKTSLVGPHRDKPTFLLNGKPAGEFASQGQQRSLVIAFKMAELQLLEEMTHQKPLLLLDDVMSELDAARRATLTSYVHQSTQTFITTTNLDYFTPEFLAQADTVSLPRH